MERTCFSGGPYGAAPLANAEDTKESKNVKFLSIYKNIQIYFEKLH